MRRLAILLLLALPAFARDAAEYRAFWVDTFNSPFASRADVARIIDAAVASNANAVFVQVRRRGDAWYLDAKEPLPEVAGFGEPDANGNPTYDPLRELIAAAHAHHVEVHAFVIVGAVWRGDRPPRDPSHVF
ncbi:MAG: family 10 glycosylhydrolase, partial [Acidobacteria bacterium]|nr:family 10 glycosylhydrolase [Acidobacteriota bacterium]